MRREQLRLIIEMIDKLEIIAECLEELLLTFKATKEEE